MKYRIVHTTTYTYEGPVRLGTHVIRLTPRYSRHLKINSCHLNISPEPSLGYSIEETDGSQAYIAYFNGDTTRLFIEHISEVEYTKYNPFSFLIHNEGFTKIPFNDKSGDFPDISPACYEKEDVSGELQDFIEAAASTSEYSTVKFASRICTEISKYITYEKRPSGAPQSANETFSRKSGSCRDISYIYLVACRYMNIPSRFVSGYTIWEGESPDLHSWVEIYIPGGGWIPFDPTDGLALSGNHIALSSSAKPELTLPVTGCFFADSGIRRDLQYSLKFTRLDN